MIKRKVTASDESTESDSRQDEGNTRGNKLRKDKLRLYVTIVKSVFIHR